MINSINKQKTAVIIIDLQNDYAHENGQMGKWGHGMKNLQERMPKIKSFVEQIRKNNLPIVHIQMTEGKDSIDKKLKEERIKKFGEAENWELAIPGTWGYELMLEVKENEKIIKKNQLDAFSNPELEEYLRLNKIENIIVLGAYTHACVNASVRSASEKGFKVILAQDLVSSTDRLMNLHEETLKVLTSQFATGLNSEEIVKAMKGGINN